MSKEFTAKQKEIVARKLGYDGPMQGFDEFLQSSPALAMKYGMIADKYMAKGGMVKKYQAGGDVQFNVDTSSTAQQKADEYKRLLQQGYTNEQIRSAAETKFGKQTDQDWTTLTNLSGTTYNPSAALSQLGKNATSGAYTGVTTMPGGVTDNMFPTGSNNKGVNNDTMGIGKDTITGDGKKTINPADRSKEMANMPTGGGTSGGSGGVKINIDPATATADQKAAEYNRLLSMGMTDAQIRAAAESQFGKQTADNWSELQRLSSTKGTTVPKATPGVEYGETGVPKAGAMQTVQAQQTATTTGQLKASDYKLSDVAPQATTSTGTAQQATAAEAPKATSYEAVSATPGVQEALKGLTGAKGTVSDKAIAQAAQGALSPEALAKAATPATAAQVQAPAALQVTEEMRARAATLQDIGGAPEAAKAATVAAQTPVQAAKFEGATPQAAAATAYNLPALQGVSMVAPAVDAAAKAGVIPQEIAAQTAVQSTAIAEQREVSSQELVDISKQALQITEPVQAVAAVASKLNQDAIAIAQQGSFSQALAEAQQGRVDAASTVQGQLTSLMEQFNNGTPTWAAGAIRAANAAMAARGLAGSSMAGAAIVQAAMEAATPIAAADAQVFSQMQLTNLNNRQQVALANAAAAQNLELANLNARQQAALQNSANAFSLQSQNLSNQQAVVLANAQIRAAAEQKNLDVKTQVALTNAARFAEVNNINLNNRQQAMLQRSAETVQIDLANLSARQQTALANLQVRAAITGQELSNEQQMAMLRSTQRFEAAQFNASNQQQAMITDFQARAALEGKSLENQQQALIFNATAVLEERKINLNNEQQTLLFNSTKNLEVDIANASNRQQAAIANAQITAALKGQELSNQQQTNVANAARVAEIAGMNFTAEQQNALANAKLIQEVNLADMSNRQAATLANAAAAAAMDMANLNARQQTSVQNAKTFLEMDLANLSNEQQAQVIKAQQLSQAATSDAAAKNAALQFNAANEQQAEQFAAKLATDVATFNTAQANSMTQFNKGQENSMAQFNTEMDARRDEFNTKNQIIIDQANAALLAQISTANTAQVNAANFENARAMNNMTLSQYNNEVQLYRDQVKMVFDSYERQEDRAAEMAVAVLRADISREAIDAQTSSALGNLIGSVLTGTKIGDSIIDEVKKFFTGG